MFNNGKLLGRMKEKGYSQERLADYVGISANSLNRKLSGKTDFKASEIEKVSNALEIGNGELYDYFFAS